MSSRRNFILAAGIALFSTAAIAQTPACEKHDFLKHGLDINQFKHCQALFNECPKTGPVLDFKCVDKVIASEKDCQQLQKIAQATQMSADMLTLENQNQIGIVKVNFPADGKNQYFLVSHDGCLINTLVDPRTVDKKLEAKYAKADFFTANNGTPVVTQQKNGTQVTVKLKVTKECVACEHIGDATVNFSFNKNGQYQAASLKNFTPA